MKSLVQIAVAMLLVMILWHVGPDVTDRWHAEVRRWRDRRSVEDTIRSTAYPIDETKWLEFDLPSQAIGLRLLTNAALTNTSLPPISPDRPRRGWDYAVDFELLDDQLQPIQQRRYHLRTRISDLQAAGTDFTEGQTWFQDSQLVPAQTRTVQVPLHHLEARPRRLRVRLGDRHEQVQEVVMRLYFKYERPDFEKPYVWGRMSLDARQRMCRASVYPADLLSPWERRNLLRWDWTALPPLGRSDVDYQHRLIYQREDPQLADWEFLPPPEGIVCRPDQPVTIPTPAADGIVQLEFFPDHQVTRTIHAVVDVLIHQKLFGVVAQHRQQPAGSAELFRFETSGELLEVTASDYLICVASWRPRGNEAAQSQDPPITLNSSDTSIRAALTNQDQPLDYEIAHVNQLPTPLRVTLRRMLPRTPASDEHHWPAQIATAEVDYEFLDEHGQSVQKGTLKTVPDVARYDRGSIGSAPMFVTEPTTTFFSVPVGVTTVRFRCDESDVAIIAFTRPRDLPRTWRIPEEQGLFEQQEELARTWFLLRARGHRERVADNRVADISIQTRPQPPHELLISGLYEWEDHRPREFTPGRFVLTKRDTSLALRDEAIASAYYQLSVDRVSDFRWRTQDITRPFEPRLMYLLPPSSDGPIQVVIDGTLFHEFLPRSRRGEISLPAVAYSPTRHSLQVNAPPGSKIFLRNIELTDAPCYTKRFVYELADEPLSFDVVKHTDAAEQLVLRTFFDSKAAQTPSPQRDPQRVAVQVRLLGVETRRAGPLTGWTLEQRVYDIARRLEEPMILFGGAEHWVDPGDACTITLADDVPPGTYRLEVRCVQPRNSLSFVSLYRVRPPDDTKRDSRIDRWNTMSLWTVPDPLSQNSGR